MFKQSYYLTIFVTYSILHITFEKYEKPNILFILADDLGYADVGYIGQPNNFKATDLNKFPFPQSVIKTPYMNKLAKEGIRLENYYVQSICSPSRSQLLSGRYQIHTGLQHGIIKPCQPNCLPINIPTLPNLLNRLGYQTHMIGKWHLGFHNNSCLPINKGFDSFYGFYNGDEDYYSHRLCSVLEGNLMDRKKLCGFDFRNGKRVERNFTNLYSAHLFVNRTKMVLSKYAHDSKFNKKPFFIYLAFQSVHAPLQVPSEYIAQYSNISDEKRRNYAGMVTCLDEAIGNVTSHIHHLGLWNNTIIVFSSDNGGQVLEGGNNWPLRGWKNSNWEGGMKTSAWITGSQHYFKKRAYSYKGLMHISDWLPTLINLAEGHHSQNSILQDIKLDGVDMWKSISEDLSSPRRWLLHNIDSLEPLRGHKNSSKFDIRIAAAIRYKHWKLITGNPGNGSWIAPPEDDSSKSILDPDLWSTNIWLFNIHKDPTECHNLAAAYPLLVERLLNKLQFYNDSAVKTRYPPEDPNCDPSLRAGVWAPWTN